MTDSSTDFSNLKLCVLGATGHVGGLTLEIAERANCKVIALAASSNFDKMFELCLKHKPKQVAMSDATAAKQLREKLIDAKVNCEVLAGPESVIKIVSCAACTVVAAISGVAGILPTMQAVRLGKRILLANKEALVTAGKHMLELANKSGAKIVPLDSEHGALLELLHLASSRKDFIDRVWLTATGGPFHSKEINLSNVSPQMAYAHPVWKMGKKISVDSATLMNKGLEIIEASLLFGLSEDMIKVVVHPQGLVHALVDFADGGTIAHCGPADMRMAISRALAWPNPHRLGLKPLDWTKLGSIEFKEPDTNRFPCLKLAQEACRVGGCAPAVLNAANEIAVEAFCDERGVSFTDISPIVEDALANVDQPSDTFEDMVEADRVARVHARALVVQLQN